MPSGYRCVHDVAVVPLVQELLDQRAGALLMDRAAQMQHIERLIQSGNSVSVPDSKRVRRPHSAAKGEPLRTLKQQEEVRNDVLVFLRPQQASLVGGRLQPFPPMSCPQPN